MIQAGAIAGSRRQLKEDFINKKISDWRSDGAERSGEGRRVSSKE
jgi:hypothetical protein